MASITTARILADKALQTTCGQECIDWATAMLMQGCDGDYLARLAGMSPPFNHFEVAQYRDRALRELGIANLSVSAAISNYAAERLRLAMIGEADLLTALSDIKDLCVAHDYQEDIYDFYLLYFAYIDLQESEIQWYWHDATRQNIDSVIRKRAEQFLNAIGANNPSV